MADESNFVGVEAETVRGLTRQTMVDAACELLARAPFACEKERAGALAQIADSLLPYGFDIRIIRRG